MKTLLLAIIGIVGISLTGCSSIGLSKRSYEDRVIAKCYDATDSLVNQLIRNEHISSKDQVVVTTFVSIANTRDTNLLAQTASELVASRMVKRGLLVSEVKQTGFLHINEHGEFLLSRDIHLLDPSTKGRYAVVGVYSRGDGRMLMSAKVLELDTKRIVATEDFILESDLD